MYFTFSIWKVFDVTTDLPVGFCSFYLAERHAFAIIGLKRSAISTFTNYYTNSNYSTEINRQNTLCSSRPWNSSLMFLSSISLWRPSQQMSNYTRIFALIQAPQTSFGTKWFNVGMWYVTWVKYNFKTKIRYFLGNYWS